jgi:hypothetical protein
MLLPAVLVAMAMAVGLRGGKGGQQAGDKHS